MVMYLRTIDLSSGKVIHRSAAPRKICVLFTLRPSTIGLYCSVRICDARLVLLEAEGRSTGFVPV